MAKNQDGKFTPPYGSTWRTFSNLLDRLGELEAKGETPPKIDRSFLSWMSGNDQTYTMAALKQFDLLGDPDNSVLPALRELVTSDGETRKAKIGELLHTYFSEILRLADDKATEAQLESAFRGYGVSGTTMQKAIRWFLQAATYAELPLSPHWSAPKTAKGGPRPGSARKPTRSVRPASPSSKRGGVTEHRHTVALKSGGKVEVSLSVNLFALSSGDREFVLDLIDRVSGYGEPVGSRSDREGGEP